MSLKWKIYEQWKRSRKNSFLSLLEFNPNAKVVDLGCCDGDITLKYKKKISCKEIYGVDIYDKNLNEAKKKGIKIEKSDLNKRLPLKNNTLDVVTSSQVIEHLSYPINFMKETYRILKPKGYAVISTENLASWDNLFALILGYTPFSMQFDGGYKIGNPLSPHEKEVVFSYLPHDRIFSWNGLIASAKFVGFEVEKTVGSGHVLYTLGEILDKRHCRFITIKVRK